MVDDHSPASVALDLFSSGLGGGIGAVVGGAVAGPIGAGIGSAAGTAAQKAVEGLRAHWRARADRLAKTVAGRGVTDSELETLASTARGMQLEVVPASVEFEVAVPRLRPAGW